MTEEELGTNPHIALLLRQYARELAQTTPSSSLDARIGHLVATHRNISVPVPRGHRRLPLYAAAAGLAALAICVGIIIGMRLEHSREFAAGIEASAHESEWPAADLTMWPTDSVSFKIPAEYSAQGTLVAVDPNSKHTSTRYWIDVVVSNDGTFRIERIVPSDPTHPRKGHDGAIQQQ